MQFLKVIFQHWLVLCRPINNCVVFVGHKKGIFLEYKTNIKAYLSIAMEYLSKKHKNPNPTNENHIRYLNRTITLLCLISS